MEAEATFLPNIDDNNIHYFVLQYSSYINSIIEDQKCVYRYCRLFVLEKKSQIFAINNCLIHNFVMSELLVICNTDSYGIFKNSIYLCLICKKLLLLENWPKFGIFNGLSCINCQSYLFTFAHLSIAKKLLLLMHTCLYPSLNESLLKLLILHYILALKPM